MREIDRGEPKPDLSHLGGFERGVYLWRHSQMRRALEDMPTRFVRATEPNVSVDKLIGATTVEVWRHDGDSIGTHTKIVASYDEQLGDFMGVSASQEIYEGDIVSGELHYSSFGVPEDNTLRAGEVVRQLRIASSEVNRQK